MRLPSVKSIRAAFKVSHPVASKIRWKLERIRDFDPHAPCAPCSRWQFTFARLEEISDLLGHHGVERLGGERHEVLYSNGGDTYDVTILVRDPGNVWNRRVWIGTWGDHVEANEREFRE